MSVSDSSVYRMQDGARSVPSFQPDTRPETDPVQDLGPPDAKTGGHVVRLGPEARAVPRRPWRRIRARAGLGDVRIHDLRHSFASGGLLVGEGLPMIGKLLGHTQVQTTARYAHLANDPVKAAANRIANRIAEISG